MASRLASLTVLVLLGSFACGGSPSATTPTPSPTESPTQSLTPGPTASPTASPTAATSSSPSSNPSPTPPANICGAPAFTPAASAPALYRASMAYDKASKQVILFGSRRTGSSSETWSWTVATGWKRLTPTTNPPGRTWGNMAYDESRQQIMLFGGQSTTAKLSGGVLKPLADTWTWDGTNWSPRSPASSPPATVNFPMAYDAGGRRVIGVRDNGARTTETWNWNGANWGHITTVNAPKWPKQGAGIAYATAASEITLFGTAYGIGVPAADTYTWTFRGNSWTAHASPTSAPKPRMSPAMSAEVGGGVLLFGGSTTRGAVYGDTWTWVQSAWQALSPSHSPPARQGAVMALDLTCGTVLLYGGGVSTQTTSTIYYDSWAWDGQDWTKVG